MEKSRILLAALAVFTLLSSVVSNVSPNNFAGLNAYAEHDDKETDDKNNNVTSDEQENQTAHSYKEHRSTSEGSSKIKIEREHDGIQVGVEVSGLNMTNAMYNTTFICDQPAFNVTLNNSLKVDDGHGTLRANVKLANATYSGCELVITSTGKVIASFDSFTIMQQAAVEDDDNDMKEKRKERMDRMASTSKGSEIHERHRMAMPSSPGDYAPNLNYTLTANGTSTQNGTTTDSSLAVKLAVWKSTGGIVLLDLVGGTVEVGNHTYTVVIGYGLYSVHHDAMRIATVAVDEDGNVVKLRISGSGSKDSAFPKGSGSIDLMFEGHASMVKSDGDWKLELKGKVSA